jgi:hypothetical protein
MKENKTCLYCNNNDVEDEMHFLLKCPLYSIERKVFMDFIYNDNNQVASLQTKDKFYWLLNNENINIINKLSEFILKNFEKRSSLNQNTRQVLLLNSYVCKIIFIYLYVLYPQQYTYTINILATHLIDTYT